MLRDALGPNRGSASRSWLAYLVACSVLALVVAFSFAVRWRVADVPLERDEGEYAYVAQRMLAGTPPYAESNTLKWPGVFLAYAAIFALGGESIRAIHLGLAVVNAGTIVLLFLLVRRWRGALAGVLTAAMFALLTLNVEMQGTVTQPEHFINLLVVGAILALFWGNDRRGVGWTFLAGALFGLAIVFKQHAAPFVLVGLVAVWQQRRDDRRPNDCSAPSRSRNVLALLAGVVVPLVAMLVAIAAVGVFERFWEWTVRYARAYTTIAGPTIGWERLRFESTRFVAGSTAVWVLAVFGVAVQFLDRTLRPQRWIVLVWLTAALAAVSPGLLFRNHYFLYLAPVVSLLAIDAGLALGRRFAGAAQPGLGAAAGAFVVAVALATMAWQQRLLLFTGATMQLSRAMYTTNPFPEALELGRYLREQSAPDDLIAVLGSEPEFYFYADRQSATGYLYMYPLMEPHENSPEMQRELIAEIESARPRYLVYVQHELTWLRFPTSEDLMLPWYQKFRQGYERVALAERDDWSDPIYRYGEEARSATPRYPYWIEVLELRRSD